MEAVNLFRLIRFYIPIISQFFPFVLVFSKMVVSSTKMVLSERKGHKSLRLQQPKGYHSRVKRVCKVRKVIT